MSNFEHLDALVFFLRSNSVTLPMQETFMSVGHIFEGHITMIHEVACNEAMSYWICQGTPLDELRKWKFVEIPEVFQIKK